MSDADVRRTLHDYQMRGRELAASLRRKSDAREDALLDLLHATNEHEWHRKKQEPSMQDDFRHLLADLDLADAITADVARIRHAIAAADYLMLTAS
eukprot:TRINITY_DN15654_c0_g1_i1.p1 TRINITY_DN15654_c0_g1~~TRINITY_DN15654_c0_g1_i1.p1  ORF type:complete len:104 (-),score=53.51 TRINITY_DN15654_c0_g1_i1:5-292(-)